VSSTSDGPQTDGSPAREQGGDFQRAVDRLEKAVHEYVGSANENLSSRATRFMDEAAERLEREASRRSRGRDRSAASSDGERARYREERRQARRDYRRRRRGRRLSRHWDAITINDPGYRTARLYRDTRNQRVSGVCAGIARYFGVEIWVVRFIAITGLIFMSQVVAPAYIIARMVIPPMPDAEDMAVRGSEGSPAVATADHTAALPELGTRLSPRGSLLSVQSELDQLELKLRLMESHVTSGQYELQRELRKIDT
jgi:phage shock protein C